MTTPFDPPEIERLRAWLGVDVTPPVDAQFIPCRNEYEWLEARRGCVGASEIGVIMGVSTYTSPYALWWRKKLDWRLPIDESQRWGHLVETPIAELFADEVSADLFVGVPRGAPYSLWAHEKYAWATCTPDRLGVTRTGDVVPVEIKSDEGGTGWGAPGTDEVPQQYRYQVWWQSFVLGAPGGYIVRKRASGRRRMVWYYVPFNEDNSELSAMLIKAADFLASIDENDPPDPDGSAATTATLQHVNPVAEGAQEIALDLYRAWEAARQTKRDATANERWWSNQMRAAMGTARFGTVKTDDGLDVIVVQRRVSKREGYTVAPTTVDELRSVGSGLNNPGAGLPGPAPRPSDTPAAEAPPEKGAGGRSPAGAGLGDGAKSEEGEAVARGAALAPHPADFSELGSDDYNPFIKDVDRSCES